MKDEANRRLSRRSLLHGGAVVLAAGAAAGAATAQQKLTKQTVQYQPTPKGNQKCSDCVNFVVPNSCKIVEGSIDPNGWCIAFAPKA